MRVKKAIDSFGRQLAMSKYIRSDRQSCLRVCGTHWKVILMAFDDADVEGRCIAGMARRSTAAETKLENDGQDTVVFTSFPHSRGLYFQDLLCHD